MTRVDGSKAPSGTNGNDRRSVLSILVAAWISLATLAFWPGWVDGQWSFTLYRETKHVALAVLGWLWLALMTWKMAREGLSSWLGTIASRAGRPPLLALFAWLTWMTIGRAWVRVPVNHAYEMLQWFLLVPALLLLLAWHDRQTQFSPAAPLSPIPRSRVETVVIRSVIGAVGVACLLGCIQAWQPLPGLLPIQPHLGAAQHTSVFGWKNPMAMAIIGQLFLLVEETAIAKQRGSKLWVAWAGLLLVELVYLATLGSRTSYFALAAGSAFFLLFSYLEARGKGQRGKAVGLRILVASILIAISVSALLGLSPRFRDRMASVAEHVTRPELYWHSDRGTYLRNTLVMVEHHPRGVGLGDWQTHYPVFRKFDRDRSFSPEIQLRRAHSDHVQALGEGGWLGLGLWLLALFLAILAPLGRLFRKGDRVCLGRAAQMATWTVAMATDYVTEMPYHKLLLALLLFLSLARERPAPPEEADSTSSVVPTPRLGFGLAIGMTVLAGVMMLYHLGLGAKVILAARSNVEHRMALGPEIDERGRLIHLESLERVVASGYRFESLPGLHKGLHRDYAVFASAALLLAEASSGERAEHFRRLARHWCERSLDLHPYYIVAMKLMSRIAVDKNESDNWLRAYYYILVSAEEGYKPEIDFTSYKNDH